MADEEDAATAQGHDTGTELHTDPETDARVARALASFGVAEDLCAAWVHALVDDVTSQLQVREDNERCLRVASQAAWRQVVDACTLLLTAWPESTLDGSVSLCVSRESTVIREEEHDDDDDESVTVLTSGSNDGRRMQQVLRIHVEDDAIDSRDVPTRQEPVATASRSLDALWHVLSTQRAWVERRLTLFPSSRFRASAVPSVGRPGEWELPPEDLSAFLRDVVVASGLSVLSESVSDAVTQRNAALLTKKRHTRSRLQLQHVELCVQSALLASETTPSSLSPNVPFFATELVLSESDATSALLLVGLHAGPDAPRIDIDRSATGVVTHKALAGATLAKQQNVVRDIVRMLKRNSFKSSKWDDLRRRVLTTPDQQHVAIAVEASMALSPAPTPTPPTRRSSSAMNVSGRKKTFASGSSTTTTTKPTPLVVEPDAATLSNIFSLGTPRQLSAEELARRNDILAVLEREEQRATRKLAVASFTALTGIPPPSTVMDDSDKVWREYTAAVSSVTLTGEGCGAPPVSGETADKKKVKRSSDKTKFDLALEAPEFDVADGNTPARRAMMELASVSPVKRGRHRGGTQTLGRGASPSVPVSPVATMTAHAPTTPGNGHLPQLDTSRLAAGVKAVVRGVEKRGPRPSPSRNSRLRLHNYHTTQGHEPGPSNAAAAAPSQPKTPKTPQARSPPANDPTRSSHLPPVSPIKASPHRKHVAFVKPTGDAEPSKPSPQPPSTNDSEPLSRRFPAKQPTWENRRSPPRVRVSSRPRRQNELRAFLARRLAHEAGDSEEQEDEDEDEELNATHHRPQQQQQKQQHRAAKDWRPHAPRRHLVAHGNEDDDEDEA